MLNQRLKQAIAAVGQVILGKDKQIQLIFAAFLARGHVLLEDLPGMGKTTLAETLAKVIGLQFKRIQFTSDLLPADIIGVSIFDKQQESFNFLEGPIFTEILLVDEINRATPKTQSALLEAMEERQVTVDGQTRKLHELFFVMATQNPSFEYGTFALPQSQLDRFCMSLKLGYPDEASEKAIMLGEPRRDILKHLDFFLEPGELASHIKSVSSIYTSSLVIDYIYRLVQETRVCNLFENGLSPRGSLALLNLSKAHAYLEGRDHVMPDDIQWLFPYVIGHRLIQKDDHEAYDRETMANMIIDKIPVE